ncbi:MAG TPA: SLC13 family permease [Acidimicrobiales bacterium]|nr:SLC13 family permease [Acidimicrobiales bacterium]
MTADAWVTLAVVMVTLMVLVTERVPPAATILGATTALFVIGVTDASQAFSGFSNPAPITVAALYVVAAAVEATGALEWLTRRTLPGAGRGSGGAGRGGGGARRAELARFLPAGLVPSALLNNTTIVAMLAPRVVAWSRQTGRPASTLLMPLSFAAIVGGLITAIGTSTNLIVSGLLEASGDEPMGLFEIARVGVPVAVVAYVILVVASPRLLPERRPPQLVGPGSREFTVEMVVADRSPLDGETVAGGGLRNLEGVYLVELEREGRVLAPVAPDEVLEVGDRLTFAGNVGRVVDLHRLTGLVPAEERHFAAAGDGSRHFHEMVVAPRSSLVGSTLKEADFRNQYAAAVVAIHRAGERVGGKLGTVRLRPGDVLLVLADAGLPKRLRDHHDFLVVSTLDEAGPPRRDKARWVELTILALLVVVGIGWLDILQGALLAGFAMVGLRVLSPAEARAAVDIDVIVMIAASFGIGQALATSGLSEVLAGGLVDAFGGWGNVGLLLGVLLATTLLTEVITNNAAAVLMFPIGMATASAAGLDGRPFAMAIAVGASASFLSPIGYQTNTIVYGMGGYRFGDFARLGLPLSVATVGITVLVVPLAWPF